MQLLQIFTTGFHLNSDAVFAYGLYNYDTYQWQLKIGNDLSSWEHDLNQLKSILLEIQKNGEQILMFNGLNQLYFLKFHEFNVKEFYHKHVIDIYQKLRGLREIIELPNLQLQTISKQINEDLELLSSPKLFKLWEETGNDFDTSLLRDHLRAIINANTYLEEIKQQMSRQTFFIDSYRNNIFYGQSQSKDNFFLHGDYFLYEENDGQFKLELYPQLIAYDDHRHCSFIPTEQNFSNPVPMPDKFLLIRMEGKLNIQGILDLIEFIQNLKITS